MGRKLNNSLSATKSSTGRKYRIRNELIRLSDKILRRFESDDLIWVRNYANGPKWIKGVVERQLGSVLYEISARGCFVQRHVDQLRLRVDDHILDNVADRKDPQSPTMLATNTDKPFPNKLNGNLSTDPNTATVLSPATSPVTKDHPSLPEDVGNSFSPNLGDLGSRTSSSTDSSSENLIRRPTRIKRATKFFGIDD